MIYQYGMVEIGFVLLLIHLLSYIYFNFFFKIEISESVYYKNREKLLKNALSVYFFYFLILKHLFNIEFKNILFEIIFNLVLIVLLDYIVYGLYDKPKSDNGIEAEYEDHPIWVKNSKKIYNFLRMLYIIVLPIRMFFMFFGYYIPITPNEVYQTITYGGFYNGINDPRIFGAVEDYHDYPVYVGVMPHHLFSVGKDLTIRKNFRYFFTKTYYRSNSTLTYLTNFFFSSNKIFLAESPINEIRIPGDYQDFGIYYDFKKFDEFLLDDKDSIVVYYKPKDNQMIVEKKKNPSNYFTIQLN